MEFIRRFPAVAITHGISQMRPVRSLQIPQRLENVPQISQIYTDFSWDVFCHADFADDADFFFIGIFFSSDATEFMLRFPAAAITHGFSQMRSVRSLQIPPESGKSPTDFTDLHRFFLGHFLGHADFADDADFFLMGFFSSDDTEFIRRFPAAAITHGFSQMRPVRSLQIPPEVGQKDSPEIP